MNSIYTSRGMSNANSGFCAMFNNTINVCKLHQDIFRNNNILILESEIEDLFSFKEINENKDYTYDIESHFNELVSSGNYDNSSNAHTIADYNKILEKNKTYNDIFQIKDISEYNKELIKFIDDKTLSIHIRGTDKYLEIEPPNTKIIESYIDNMLNNNDITSIFLATDDILYRKLLIDKYGDILKYREQNISMDGKPIHRIPDRSKINKDLMIDIYLLSKSKYFLYSFSNVSYLALVMGIENFKKIKCINEAI